MTNARPRPEIASLLEPTRAALRERGTGTDTREPMSPKRFSEAHKAAQRAAVKRHMLGLHP